MTGSFPNLLLRQNQQMNDTDVIETFGRKNYNGTASVSVVIPSYNHADYIGKTIQSVLNQTQKEVEVIIIDDGSRDNSREVIEAVVELNQEQNIVAVFRENRGLCRTLNEGLRMAAAPFFSYLGSDDLWHEAKLENQKKKLDLEFRFAACYSDCYSIDGNDDIMHRFGEIYAYREGQIYDDLVWMNFHPASPTNFFRTEVLRDVGGFNENHRIEDWDLWIRIARQHPIGFINQPLASWRNHNSNASKNFDGMYTYLTSVLDDCASEDEKIRKVKHQILSRIDARFSYTLFNAGSRRDSLKFAVKALRNSPFNHLAWKSIVMNLLGKSSVDRLRLLQH